MSIIMCPIFILKININVIHNIMYITWLHSFIIIPNETANFLFLKTFLFNYLLAIFFIYIDVNNCLEEIKMNDPK